MKYNKTNYLTCNCFVLFTRFVVDVDDVVSAAEAVALSVVAVIFHSKHNKQTKTK